MEIRYFAKEIPATPIYLNNGKKVVFDTVDGIVGYTMTADPGIIAQLSNCMARGVGGVRGATEDEYSAFIEQKKIQSGVPRRQPAWREEVKPAQYAPDPGGRANPAAEDAAKPKETAKPSKRPTSQEPAGKESAAGSKFKPRTGKAKRK